MTDLPQTQSYWRHMALAPSGGPRPRSWSFAFHLGHTFQLSYAHALSFDDHIDVSECRDTGHVSTVLRDGRAVLVSTALAQESP